jgi:hypothetical protein
MSQMKKMKDNEEMVVCSYCGTEEYESECVITGDGASGLKFYACRKCIDAWAEECERKYHERYIRG